MASLDSVRKKTLRAKQNFDELTAETFRYFQSNPGKVVVQPESTPDEIIASFEPKDVLPSRLPLITGDCLQNLRSSLDYLVWELVLAEGKEPGKHNSFPICPGPTSDSFDKALERRGKRPGCLEGIHVDAVTEIRKLQPYRWLNEWGMDLLWVLNELTNFNKHRRILLTDLRGEDPPPDFQIVDVDRETWGHGSFPAINTKAKLAPFLVTSDPNMHRQIVARIFFNETVAQGREVSSVLVGLFEYIYDDILPRFEGFFPK